MNKKNKVISKKEKVVRSINNNIRSSVRKLNPILKGIVGKKYGEILGAHIIGSDATELITEYGLAMNMEATVDEIHRTIHAHPTMSEALAEAAAATQGEAIHI